MQGASQGFRLRASDTSCIPLSSYTPPYPYHQVAWVRKSDSGRNFLGYECLRLLVAVFELREFLRDREILVWLPDTTRRTLASMACKPQIIVDQRNSLEECVSLNKLVQISTCIQGARFDDHARSRSRFEHVGLACRCIQAILPR